MLKRGLVLVMSFAMVSSAFGGATVDFNITDLGNTPCNGADGCVFGDSGANPDGTYNGGETILVHVMVTASESFLIRGSQIDWRASSPELTLGQDIDAVNQPIDGIPNFWFDYSPIVLDFGGGNIFPQGSYPANGLGGAGSTTGGYTDFSNLQQGDPLVDFVAASIWASATELPGMLAIEEFVPYRLGGMVVTLPTEVGIYTLDVLNLANTDDSNFGMVLDFGFGTGPGDEVTKWASAADGDGVDDVIVYNPSRGDVRGGLQLEVIPEPATLILLGLGGLAAVRRRRK